MQVIKKFLPLLVLGLLPFVSVAQRSYTTLSYNIALPMGSTADYIENTSFRGVGVEYGTFITPSISLGGGISWNVFNQEQGRVTETFGEVTYTGSRFNYFNAVPIFLLPRYFFIPPGEGGFSSYAGVGIGTIYARQTFDIGGLRSEASDWQFALAPELGAIFKLPIGAGLNVNVRYNTGFESSDLPATSYLGVNVGPVFVR